MASQSFTKLKNGSVPGKWDDLEPLFEELDITPKFILESLRNIAVNAEKDRDKLKALDMLAKFTGIKPPERILVSTLDGLKIEFGESESA